MNPVAPGPDEEEADYRDSAVEELIRANVESNATMVDLVERVRVESEVSSRKVEVLEENQRQARKLLLMVAALLALMVLVGVVNAVNIGIARENAEVTARTAKDAGGTYKLLFGCLNPEGDCAKQSAQKSRAVLDEVKQYELTILYCVRLNPQAEDPKGLKFLACVERLYPGGPKLNSPAQ